MSSLKLPSIGINWSWFFGGLVLNKNNSISLSDPVDSQEKLCEVDLGQEIPQESNYFPFPN